MRRPPTWPELDRLSRFVRAADSLTDTLATWTGHGVEVEIVRRVDRVFPDPVVAEHLDLHDGARVQEREVRMRCAGPGGRRGPVVGRRRLGGADPGGAASLRCGGAWASCCARCSGAGSRCGCAAARRAGARPGAPVLAVQARLDVAGTPVAWCEETIYEAVFAWDGRRRAGMRPAWHPVPA